ncbi:hypothetical protein HD806DRAFT_523138 [Xylariaceae sp. AK1471]|nr:hypothetical protein HD806DRAFT_523138 [Xylariaceae sp. AK1471]
MVSIAVEPPTQIQLGMALYPPLVVSCPKDQYSFFQVMLVDSHGGAVDSGSLQGTLSMSPQALETSKYGGRDPKDFAIFPDLVIGRSGTYTIRVNAYHINYQEYPPTVLHKAVVSTREIQVHSSAITEGRPSNRHPHSAHEEATLLSMLSEAGFPTGSKDSSHFYSEAEETNSC